MEGGSRRFDDGEEKEEMKIGGGSKKRESKGRKDGIE